MIRGVGCDIVKISRIAALVQKYGNSFKERIFTDLEIASAPKDSVLEAAYYAKRFAAKEAFAKAAGTGLGRHGLNFLNIEVSSDTFGAPQISSTKFPDSKVLVSLSDEKEFAIAYVVIMSCRESGTKGHESIC